MLTALSFKDQKTANSVRRQMRNMSANVAIKIKVHKDWSSLAQNPKREKAPIVNGEQGEHSFPTNVAWIQFPGPTLYVCVR